MNRREMLSCLTTGVAALGPLPALPALSRSQDERSWSRYREHFLLPKGVTYLNCGSLGISPRPVIQAMHRHLLQTEAMEDRLWGEYPRWGYETSLEYRSRIADLVGAKAREIVLTRNATEGMNIVGNGLPLRLGDEVLLTDQEHPGGRAVWDQRARREGIQVREFSFPTPPTSPGQILQRMEDAIGPRTRVISVSHITTTTGSLLPAKEISTMARERGIVTLIDGAHAMGQIPLNLDDLGCDYYASSPHKWLLSPKGTGMLYCREGMAERLWCHTASQKWDRRDLGCERLCNVGTSSQTLLEGLLASIDFCQEAGQDRLTRRMEYLNRTLRRLLEEIPGIGYWTGPAPELSAGMVKATLPVPKLGAIARQLWEEHRIWLITSDATEKAPATIRFSLPPFILASELERTVALLKEPLA